MPRNITFATTTTAAAAAATAAALCLAAPAGAAPVRPAASGTENFSIVTTSATSRTASVIATGVFTAGGVDHQTRTTETFVFPAGSVRVKPTGTPRQSLNPKTCLFTVTERGTYKISGGTGTYANIRGSGRYKLTILAVLATSGGKCSMTKAPLAWQQTIKASGPASLPPA